MCTGTDLLVALAILYDENQLIQHSLYDGGRYGAVLVALAILYDENWLIRRFCCRRRRFLKNCWFIGFAFDLMQKWIRFVDKQYLLELERIHFVDA